MTGQNPLDFIPLNELSDERSGGQVASWITSWRKERTGAAWGGRALKNLAPDDWFQLHTQDRPRLWTPPTEAMETVVELFNEDCLAHPHIPHVFAIPRLMTHLCRKQSYNDTDVLFTINAGPYFWPCSMHEPLIVLIVLTLDHVSNYIGIWVLRGISPDLEVQDHLDSGFKHPELYVYGKFHDLEGPVYGVRYPKEEWIRSLLLKFLEAQKSFPPVLCSLVRRMLPPSPGGSFLITDKY